MAIADRVIHIPGGRVILPLLTLGGIAFLINYFYGRPKRISRSVKNLKVKSSAEVDEDYFRQLPDDVLSRILGNLTVKDAVMTSILSRRWRYSFASMPKLNIDCLAMFGVGIFDDHHGCSYYQQRFLKGVNMLLQLYSGSRVPHINMTFCFGRELSCEFEHWMRSISGLGVERLCLSFICGSVSVSFTTTTTTPLNSPDRLFRFALELLSQASLLKHLDLYHCTVQLNSEVCFRSLETLSLTAVLLASGQLEGILSSCFNLKQLTLKLCNLPYKLRFSSTVTDVTFHICGGVKEIDFQAANLRALDFHCFDNVRFIFSFVPKLENVTIHPSKAETMSYIFGDFARDLPAQVKSLAVRCGHEIKCVPIDMKMFRNIRQLSLSLFDLYDSDILNISLLLGACPLLQYLNLTAPQVEKRARNKEEVESLLYLLYVTLN
ncbi:putative F-box/LRR-repeat protein At3g58880 isoform X2 [Lycium barbarum]|nr:putative F-box/LRR-repeat protein At3g58880 isoform X2 [Lycium barbarum]XP_060209361.1 putative F-box/LRR-repeat protein At3g58880 isoform X2 [Lycium barbarum]XP_060209362.1 putative F-box/LRR-repeat protein At3g58880 isoform X2 [Lycium barbarum]